MHSVTPAHPLLLPAMCRTETVTFLFSLRERRICAVCSGCP